HAKATPLLLRRKADIFRAAPPALARNPFGTTALFYTLMDIFAVPQHADLPATLRWIAEHSAALPPGRRTADVQLACVCVTSTEGFGAFRSHYAILAALLALVAMGCIETLPSATVAPRSLSPSYCACAALAPDAPYVKALAVATAALHDADDNLFMLNRVLHDGLVIRTETRGKMGIMGLFAGMAAPPERVAEVRVRMAGQKETIIARLLNAADDCAGSERFVLASVIAYMKKEVFVPRTCTSPQCHAELLQHFEECRGRAIAPLWIPYTTFLNPALFRPPIPFAFAVPGMPLRLGHFDEYGTCLPTTCPVVVFQPVLYTTGTGTKTELCLRCTTDGAVQACWRVDAIV
ncbi:MAG: hypothetical protein AAB368_17640, partial [bacterium]